ncbi:MAG: RNA-binding transcriptional accessory protein, partial [Muribaculaceae bacterium]|nr:RNA-binding transcriptional accessory protein [Muribaculaceae bacterium]
MTDITDVISRSLGIGCRSVGATVELLDSGATVPFIARYRKERTGSLDEVQVRAIETCLGKVRELEKRKESICGSMAEAGVLTPELQKRIADASTMTELEDIYAPY